MQNEKKTVITLAEFDRNLSQQSPAQALDNFKTLIEASLAAGLIKKVENAAIYYQSLKTLDKHIQNIPAERPDENKDNEIKAETDGTDRSEK